MNISAVGVRVADLPNSYGCGLPPKLKLGVLSIEAEGITGQTFIGGPGESPQVVGHQIVLLRVAFVHTYETKSASLRSIRSRTASTREPDLVVLVTIA